MELKPGYKKTEVGVIPEDWEVKPLGECLNDQPRYGINAPAVNYSDYLPVYIRITDISEDGQFSPELLVSVDNPHSKNYYLNEGDIVFARTGASVGKSYRYKLQDGPLVYAGFLIRIRTNEQILLPAFLSSYVTTSNYWNWVRMVSTRSSRPGVNGKQFKQLLVPIPTLLEQTAIATVLSDTDALIESLEQLIAKKRLIKQGAMQALLTGKRRLPGFAQKTGYKHTEVGVIPEDWEVKRLGEVGVISGGGVDKKIRPQELPVRLVNYMDVYKRSFIRSVDLEHTVSATSEQITRCNVREGDIFFTPSSEMPFDIAMSAVAIENIPDACYSYHIIRLRLHEKWDIKFCAYAFKTGAFLSQAARICEGSGIRYVITQARFRHLIISYPQDRREQTAIATILSDMDEEITALEEKLSKYRQIKQGMMQELLTGRIRLV